MREVAGKFSIIYIVSALMVFLVVFFFWSEIRIDQPAGLFYRINNHSILWRMTWWTAIVSNFMLLPLFYVLFRVFVLKNELLSSVALLLGFTAVMFGAFGMLRYAMETATLSSLYVGSNDFMVRTNLVNNYLTGRSYGLGMFYLFNLCLIGWIGLSSMAISFYGLLNGRLGLLGFLIALIWIINIIFVMFGGFLSGVFYILIFFMFLIWIFSLSRNLTKKINF